MSKAYSKNLRGFAPNSKADERYRRKQWLQAASHKGGRKGQDHGADQKK